MDLAVLKDRLGDQYDALETYVNTLIAVSYTHLNRPLPNLLRRLREEGNDIAGAQIEYLVMRHLLETQSWLIGDIAHKVASFPARGLGQMCIRDRVRRTHPDAGLFGACYL